MNYAIIAAGEGSRLRKEGFTSVKPLVKVCGEYLIERLIRIFKNNDAESISVIINEESSDLKSYLDAKDWGVKINLIIKSTPSSLHSFWNIINATGITECCLTTVDTIFNERDFAKYISYFQAHKDIDALMGVTKYIDDEKPLYVQTDSEGNISAFCDNKKISYQNKATLCACETPDGDRKASFGESETALYTDKVSAGIYCLRTNAIQKADDCIKANVSRMRNYQRSLIEADLNVKAFLFSKVIDIDHVEDIQKAEKLIKQFSTRVLCVKRFADYSPNSQNKDEQIINEVKDGLIAEGFEVYCKEETHIDFDKEYYPLVISMARNPEVIKGLNRWEQQGCKVINSSFACLNCYRTTQIKVLQDNAIPIPHTFTIATNDDIDALKLLDNGKTYWFKRGDFQTVEEIDVIKVTNLQKANEVLRNYASRGIDTAVISEHIDGDVIKFYGVAHTDFFEYTYPTKDKFNNAVNTSKQRIQINKEDFISACQKAARVLGLEIYGGDAAVSSDGSFYIIDMNDFPSFSSCRYKAAKSIVQSVCDMWGSGEDIKQI